MSLHLSYCADFGLSKADVEATPEDLACTAYTRYVLDVGMQQDFFALQLALAPCLLGYGQIAEDIVADPDAVTGEEGNRYWRWVETYIGEDFQAAVAKGREVLEAGAVGLSVRRVEELVEVFAHAIKVSDLLMFVGFCGGAHVSVRWRLGFGIWDLRMRVRVRVMRGELEGFECVASPGSGSRKAQASSCW